VDDSVGVGTGGDASAAQTSAHGPGGGYMSARALTPTAGVAGQVILPSRPPSSSSTRPPSSGGGPVAGGGIALVRVARAPTPVAGGGGASFSAASPLSRAGMATLAPAPAGERPTSRGSTGGSPSERPGGAAAGGGTLSSPSYGGRPLVTKVSRGSLTAAGPANVGAAPAPQQRPPTGQGHHGGGSAAGGDGGDSARVRVMTPSVSFRAAGGVEPSASGAAMSPPKVGAAGVPPSQAALLAAATGLEAASPRVMSRPSVLLPGERRRP